MAIPLRLKIHKGGDFVGTREFSRDLIKVGRLANAHLSIDDEKASRIHLVINAETIEKLSVVDMGSVEGTFLNGKRVSKSPLNFGDEIRIGTTTIHVEDGSVPEALPAPAVVEEGASASEMALAFLPSQETGAVDAVGPGAVAGIAPIQAGAPVASEDASVLSAPMTSGTERALDVFAPGVSDDGEWHRPTEFGTYIPRPLTPRRPLNRKGNLGLCMRYYWGDTLLETVLQRERLPVYVGSDQKRLRYKKGVWRDESALSKWLNRKKACQFEFTKEALGGVKKFKLVEPSGGDEFILHLGSTMEGGIDREGEGVKPLSSRSHCTLRPVDFAWVNISGIRVEFSFERQPKPVVVPWYVGLDFRLFGILFALMFVIGSFVISASTYTEADIIADDIGEKQLKLVKAFMKEAEKPKKNPLLDKLNKKEKKAEQQPQGGEMAEKHKGNEGKMGKKGIAPNKNKRSAPKAIDINAKDLVKHSGGLVSVLGGGGGGGGLATIFGQGGLGGDIKGAIGNMHGPQVGDAGGFGGLGLRGTGTGGGGQGNTIGIGGIGTKGRGGGLGGYGAGVGGLGGKKKSDVAISDGESTIQGSLDKELIRQVIQRNMGQIRYCYEKELQRKPDLAGKVIIRFEISGTGAVPSAKVHTGSTLRDAALGECITVRIRNWRFPEPKGGGKVIVTYPFVFKSSGD